MKIAVALSGGVDSSAAAAVVKEQGDPAFGITMRLFPEAASSEAGQRLPVAGVRRGRCCGGDDTQTAREAARVLGMPFYVLDMEATFRESVLQPFVRAYQAAATPTPCTECNTRVKFDHLLRRALGMGADHLATGHYAQVQRDPGSGRMMLSRGVDRDKDQSYFLFGLTQEMLSRVLFPVGGLNKSAVRQIAHSHRLPNAGKAESQDLCFVPDGDYRGFVRRMAGDREKGGAIVDLQGRVLGKHAGVSGFTVGQRRGLGMSAGQPLYVIALHPETRRVVVGPRQAAQCRELVTGPVNWVSRGAPSGPLNCTVQIRHRGRPAEAEIMPLPAGSARIRFREPVMAPSRGQSAVFYEEDRLLGGGSIQEATCAGLLDQDSADLASALGLPAS